VGDDYASSAFKSLFMDGQARQFLPNDPSKHRDRPPGVQLCLTFWFGEGVKLGGAEFMR
jgi:hypothetical protein